MDLNLTDEQEAARDTAREFAESKLLPKAAELDEAASRLGLAPRSDVA